MNKKADLQVGNLLINISPHDEHFFGYITNINTQWAYKFITVSWFLGDKESQNSYHEAELYRYINAQKVSVYE